MYSAGARPTSGKTRKGASTQTRQCTWHSVPGDSVVVRVPSVAHEPGTYTRADCRRSREDEPMTISRSPGSTSHAWRCGSQWAKARGGRSKLTVRTWPG